jgi:hypothetical protein
VLKRDNKCGTQFWNLGHGENIIIEYLLLIQNRLFQLENYKRIGETSEVGMLHLYNTETNNNYNQWLSLSYFLFITY